MKLYTRRGDKGQTDLIGGLRVPKSHLRIAAIGSIDELNAAIGLALANCETDAVHRPLITAQATLFALGAQLASPESEQPASAALSADLITQLEQAIDSADQGVAPLRNFILPGGTELAARLHLARTVCRRAERGVVALAETEPIDELVTAYLNRLADLLFALARLANALAGVEDIPWTGATGST